VGKNRQTIPGRIKRCHWNV
jgi:hypothetical protein